MAENCTHQWVRVPNPNSAADNDIDPTHAIHSAVHLWRETA